MRCASSSCSTVTDLARWSNWPTVATDKGEEDEVEEDGPAGAPVQAESTDKRGEAVFSVRGPVLPVALLPWLPIAGSVTKIFGGGGGGGEARGAAEEPDEGREPDKECKMVPFVLVAIAEAVTARWRREVGLLSRKGLAEVPSVLPAEPATAIATQDANRD